VTRRAAGRFPLTPGRPLVHRRPNGRWGYTCCCVGHSRNNAVGDERHNCADHAEALRAALAHVETRHLTMQMREVLALEALYVLSAAPRP
jgi:hypothetical protein